MVEAEHRNNLSDGYNQRGLRHMVERLFVERLFTDGQKMDGQYVEITKFKLYGKKCLHLKGEK